MTLFEQCCDAAAAAGSDPLVRLPDGGVALDHVTVTRAVLTCVLDNTGSIATRDELRLVLGEGE